tara:strand:- start:324 stop:716 length:393 start_codon:yes stop_codon:yes gene_type:complete
LTSKKIKIGSNKSFGIVFFVFFLIIAFYSFFFQQSEIKIWALILSFIFLFLGLLNSFLLTPLNKIWFKFGLLLGNIVSPVVMGFIFFLIVTPTALILRLFKKDILNLKKNKSFTYWIKKSGPKSKMKDQF